MAAIACLSAAPARAQSPNDPVYLFTSFREPGDKGLQFLTSEDGLHWEEIPGHFLKPSVGSGKLMRDPSLARGPDGVFHLVWTTAWKGDRGFGYASSKDLVHWSEQRFIPVMEHEPTTVNVWAPELFYDDKAERFVICWASTIPGRFPDNGEPHDNNQRMYYTTTKDFVDFAPTQIFCEPGFSVIDAAIVPDGDRYILVLKENSRQSMKLRVADGLSPVGPWSKPSEPFTPNFSEGPTVLRLGEQWFIYYDEYRAGRYGAAKTRDFKTFEDATADVSFPKGHKHGTVLTVNRSEVDNLRKASAGKAEYTRVITERADKIVVALELADPALTIRVRDCVAAQYRTLRDIHSDRDALLKEASDDTTKASVRAASDAKLLVAHRRFVATLSAMVTPAQVDAIKDGLTYNVVPITWKRYQLLLPQLTEEQKTAVLANLLEAREYAMDAGSSEEKHAMFGKYKGRINNYLSAQGFNMKQAEIDLAEREKANR